MSKPTKLLGGSDSEISRFKMQWRDSMSESAREYWRELFSSDTSQAEIRKLIFAKLKIKLDYDKQLNRFRDWELNQQERNLQAERMREDERQLIEEHGEDWTLEEIRKEVLKRSYARTLATGDFEGLGLKTVSVDLRQQSQTFEEAKFKESLRTKLETALNALAEHIKGNTKAKAAYEAFRTAVAETTK